MFYVNINTSLPIKNGNAVVLGPLDTVFYGSGIPTDTYDLASINQYSFNTITDYNIVVLSGVQSSVSIPNGTQSIRFKNRFSYDTYFSFNAGYVTGINPYSTLNADYSFYDTYDGLYNETLYFSSHNSGIIEVSFTQ